MTETILRYKQYAVRTYSLNTVVVGTGAAGYNAANRLYNYGQKDIAMVTEHINAGTSRNTGSDKQTYYKLTLAGGDGDSVREMAETLFEGQCVDGDHALCEASLSAQGFLNLVELGVAFPRNRYGEFIGYKTDHDPRRRATSVGPYTSKRMTECLQAAVEQKGIRVFDKLQVIKVLTNGERVQGLLCLNLAGEAAPEDRFVAFNCKNVVYATGGPAGMYANSVYPAGHYGSTGLAFEAGVIGKNLTEWQYGLASVKPRWNVSGTYMQVLPRFISTDADGNDEKEFLYDFFEEEGSLLSKVFLKGYQWPFDVRKVEGGSSIVDILVYLQTLQGRRVFLDFRQNPGGKEVDFSLLEPEAREYLEKAGACFGTPLQRLLHMNTPAVEFYKDKGVDLASQPLEIALCAQHNNGGLDIDCWWQTNLAGFFAAGEAAASHGVYRPGGSALNAGQVGSTRAAQYIAQNGQGEADTAEVFEVATGAHIEKALQMAETAFDSGEENVRRLWDEAARRMSSFGAAIRSEEGIEKTAEQVQRQIATFAETVKCGSPANLRLVYRLWDVLICQLVYLRAMQSYMQAGGKSRGSALYSDSRGKKPYAQLPDTFTFIVDDGSKGNVVQLAAYKNGRAEFSWRPVRPIPEDEDFFESVWRTYRENKNIY
ncbi:MAG: FAD-binding protein [Oscillospiraceae bacterium]